MRVEAPKLVAGAVGFLVVMFIVVRPLLRRLALAYQRAGHLTPNQLAIVVSGFLTSAFFTGWIGLHVIFGAFVFGVVMPRGNTAAMVREILERLEQVSVLLLLPVFFVVTGLNANITNLGPDGVTVLLGVLLVAISGKFVGAASAARLQGMSGRRSWALGVLMNSRGLTELVILSVGVSLKVLDQSLFTILVLMAVITTIITGPLLRIVYPTEVLEREIAEAERASLGIIDAYRVVALIEDPAKSAGLVELGAALVVDDTPSELVLSRFIQSGRPLEVASGLTLDLVEVATGLAEMQSLATRLQSEGVPAVVNSQATGDLVQSVTSQAEAIGCDTLVLRADFASGTQVFRVADRLMVSAGTTVGVWSDPTEVGICRGQTIEVHTGPGSDGDVALELAIRVADGIGGELVFVPRDRRESHRFERIAHDLTSAGLRSRVLVNRESPESPPNGQRRLTVSAVSSLHGPRDDIGATAGELAETTHGPVLLVKAGRAQSDDGLSRLVERLCGRSGTSHDGSVPGPQSGEQSRSVGGSDDGKGLFARNKESP